MEAVAEHINEMQKIFEEYGSVFDELSKMFREIHPQKKVNILLMRIEDYCNETSLNRIQYKPESCINLSKQNG